MRNKLKVVMVILGTIIGAGFASGREMYLFFNYYGKNGILGIIVSCVITSIIVYKVLKLILYYEISSYSEFLEIIGSKGKIIKIIINLFLLISFFVMIAGFNAYFEQEIAIHPIVGTIICCILCYITFCKDVNGIVKMNTFLIPVLILFIIFLGFKNVENIAQETLIQAKSGWLKSAVLYASYNSIVLIPMLISIRKYIKPKQEKNISLLVFICIFILAIIIFVLIASINTIDVQTIEMPMVYIANNFGYRYLYGIMVLIAIFTSAISAGYGLLENLKVSKKTERKIAFFMCLIALLVCNVGFANLVSLLYPIFGYLGLIQIVFVLYKKIAK